MRHLVKKYVARSAGLLCSLLMLTSLPAQADRLSDQRRQYDQAQSALARGDNAEFQRLKAGLGDYPLYPYLLLNSLRKRLDHAPHQEVEQFLTAHGDLPTARGLKQDWLQRLAKEQEWERLRRHVDADSLTAELECPLVMQTWREGRTEQAMQRTRELWTVGKSQPDICDPLFQRWMNAGGLTEEVAWERIREALLYRQDGLAKYLTRYMPTQTALADRFVATASNPKLLNQFSRYQPGPASPRISSPKW